MPTKSNSGAAPPYYWWNCCCNFYNSFYNTTYYPLLLLLYLSVSAQYSLAPSIAEVDIIRSICREKAHYNGQADKLIADSAGWEKRVLQAAKSMSCENLTFEIRSSQEYCVILVPLWSSASSAAAGGVVTLNEQMISCLAERLTNRSMLGRYLYEIEEDLPLCFFDDQHYYVVTVGLWMDDCPKSDFVSSFQPPSPYACESGGPPQLKKDNDGWAVLECPKKDEPETKYQLVVFHPFPTREWKNPPHMMGNHLKGRYAKVEWKCREMVFKMNGVDDIKTATMLVTFYPQCPRIDGLEKEFQAPSRYRCHRGGIPSVVEHSKAEGHIVARCQGAQEESEGITIKVDYELHSIYKLPIMPDGLDLPKLMERQSRRVAKVEWQCKEIQLQVAGEVRTAVSMLLSVYKDCPRGDLNSEFRGESPRYRCEKGGVPSVNHRSEAVGHFVMECRAEKNKEWGALQVVYELHAIHQLPIPPDGFDLPALLESQRGRLAKVEWPCKEMLYDEELGTQAATVLLSVYKECPRSEVKLEFEQPTSRYRCKDGHLLPIDMAVYQQLEERSKKDGYLVVRCWAEGVTMGMGNGAERVYEVQAIYNFPIPPEGPDLPALITQQKGRVAKVEWYCKEMKFQIAGQPRPAATMLLSVYPRCAPLELSKAFNEPSPHSCEEKHVLVDYSLGEGHFVLRCLRNEKKKTNVEVAVVSGEGDEEPTIERYYDLHALYPLPIPPHGIDPAGLIEKMRGLYATTNWGCRRMWLEHEGKKVETATVLFTSHPFLAACEKRGLPGYPPLPQVRNLGEWKQVSSADGVLITHQVADAELGELYVEARVYSGVDDVQIQGEIPKYDSFFGCLTTVEEGEEPELGKQPASTKPTGVQKTYVFHVKKMLEQCGVETNCLGRHQRDASMEKRALKALVPLRNSDLRFGEADLGTDDPRKFRRSVEIYDKTKQQWVLKYYLISYQLRGPDYAASGEERKMSAAEAKRFLQAEFDKYNQKIGSVIRKKEVGNQRVARTVRYCFQLSEILYLIVKP